MKFQSPLLALLLLSSLAFAVQDVRLGFGKLSGNEAPFNEAFTLESVLVVQEIPDQDFGGNRYVLPNYRSFASSLKKLKEQVKDFLPTGIAVDAMRIAQADYSSRPVTMLVTVNAKEDGKPKSVTWKATKPQSGNRVDFSFPKDFEKGGGFFGILKLPEKPLGYDQEGVETVFAGWAFEGIEPEITLGVKPILYDENAYEKLKGDVQAFGKVTVSRDTKPLEADFRQTHNFDPATQKDVVYHAVLPPKVQDVQGAASAHAPQWTGRTDSEDLKYVPNGEYNLVLTATWTQDGKEETATLEKGPVKVVSFQNEEVPAQYKLAFKPGNRFVFGDYSYVILDLSGSRILVRATDQQFGTTHLAKNERDTTRQIPLDQVYPVNVPETSAALTTKADAEKTFLAQFVFSRPSEVELQPKEVIFTVRQKGSIVNPAAPSPKPVEKPKPAEDTKPKPQRPQQPPGKIITSFDAKNFNDYVYGLDPESQRRYARIGNLQKKIFVRFAIARYATVKVEVFGPTYHKWEQNIGEGASARNIYFSLNPAQEEYYRVVITATNRETTETRELTGIKVGRAIPTPPPSSGSPADAAPVSTGPVQPPAQSLMRGTPCFGAPKVSSIYRLVTRATQQPDGPWTTMDATFTRGSCVVKAECKNPYKETTETPQGEHASDLSRVFSKQCAQNTICCGQIQGQLYRDVLSNPQSRPTAEECSRLGPTTKTVCERKNPYCVFKWDGTSKSECRLTEKARQAIHDIAGQYQQFGDLRIQVGNEINRASAECNARYEYDCQKEGNIFRPNLNLAQGSHSNTINPIGGQCEFIELTGTCDALTKATSPGVTS